MPKNKPKEDSQKPSEFELEDRISFTMSLLTSHLHKSQIKAGIRQFVDKQTNGRYGRKGTQLCARTIETYIARAKERMREANKEQAELQSDLAVAFYSKTIADPKVKTIDKLRARENLDRIFAIGQTQKMEHHVAAEITPLLPDGARLALEVAYGKKVDGK